MASSVLTKGVPQIPDKVLPITDFAPDVDPITPGAMLNCTNLYPTWKGWRTYPSLVKFAGVTGLVGRLNGAGPKISGTIELVSVTAIPAIDFHTGSQLFETTQTGFVSIECGGICATGQFAEVAYDGWTTLAGPVIRVPTTWTSGSFTGYAAIYNPLGEFVRLVKYVNEGLSPTSGTILATAAQHLALTDVLRIESITANEYQIYVNGVKIIGPITDTGISPDNPCAGFISVGAPLVDFVVSGSDFVLSGADFVTSAA